MIWKNPRSTFDLMSQSVVMGILNTTPDSFSDGGENTAVDQAVANALTMVTDGAGIIDIGGESTRPGAVAVSVEEEIRRTVPVIQELRRQSDVVISIDTSKPAVALVALEAGADIVNDVTGLRSEEMVRVCADSGAGVCVMHMQGSPQTMQEKPDYTDVGGVLSAVKAFFCERAEALQQAGIDPGCLCFDPGIGFGKTLEHNMELLRHLGELQQDFPLLLGVSRKSCLGAITGVQEPAERDAATAVVTALAYQQGVRLHRVHHVQLAVQALEVVGAMSTNEK